MASKLSTNNVQAIGTVSGIDTSDDDYTVFTLTSVNEYTGAEDQRVKETFTFTCVVKDSLSAIVRKHMQNGQQVGISGKLKENKIEVADLLLLSKKNTTR